MEQTAKEEEKMAYINIRCRKDLHTESLDLFLDVSRSLKEGRCGIQTSTVWE